MTVNKMAQAWRYNNNDTESKIFGRPTAAQVVLLNMQASFHANLWFIEWHNQNMNDNNYMRVITSDDA